EYRRMLYQSGQKKASATQEHDAEQRQHDETAQKAELFADDGEDEIGVPGGQKVQLRLGAAEQAFAEKAARADGDHGLDDVPAFVVAVAVRVQEHDEAVDLIRFQNRDPALNGRH